MSKRILLGLGVLLFALEIQAQVTLLPRRPTAVAAPAGPTYLVSEDFEGTGVPSGWITNEYMHGSFCDISVDPLVGTESALCTNSAAMTSPTWSKTSSNWLFAAIRWTNWSINTAIIGLSTNTLAADQAYLQLRSTPAIRMYHGSVFAGSGTLVQGTVYYLWMEYIPGTGANGIARLYISTDIADRGVADVEITTGTSTVAPDRAIFRGGTSVFFDKIRVDDTIINSSPE